MFEWVVMIALGIIIILMMFILYYAVQSESYGLEEETFNKWVKKIWEQNNNKIILLEAIKNTEIPSNFNLELVLDRILESLRDQRKEYVSTSKSEEYLRQIASNTYKR